MEFGITMFGDVPFDASTQQFGSSQQKINELLEQIKLADEVGIDMFGIGEHHREDYAVSRPPIVLAAAAAQTKNIRLSSSVTVLSSDDPVRVYEEFATVDLISNGRAEIMVGRGSFIESFPLYGYNLDSYETLFDEKLDLLVQINKTPTLTWRGKMRAPLINQTVLPRAAQKALPIWVAVGGTPESAVRAARLGLPMMVAIIGGNPIHYRGLYDLYRQEYSKAGHARDDMTLGVNFHMLVGENGRAIADKYYPVYADQMDRIGRDRGWSPYNERQFEMGRARTGHLFIDEPNAIVDKMLYAQELFHVQRFTGQMDVGAPEHKDIMKSIELLGTKVIPEVKKALAV